MVSFILTSLAILLVAFLVMIAAQIISIERKISDIAEFTEVHVRRIYGKE